jgi:DNA-binding transcriptional LysR family regulator
MHREALGELVAFLAVAEEGSFTRAAVRLETSQSAVSQTIRRLEERLGVRLLTRTTRRVSTTDAGDRLVETLRPAFNDIAAGVGAIGALRDKPAGTVRITSGQHAADTLLWPAVARLLPKYPDIRIEISTDSMLTDIVTDRFDAGVRLGEQVDRDMIAIPIGPDLRMIVVGAPSYVAGRTMPTTPHELTTQSCINVRLPTSGAVYAWEFAKDGRDLKVRVDGPLIFNNVRLALRAAVEGFGLAFVFEDMVTDLIASGDLVQVLDDWCPSFAGYHLYYPNRRQASAAFSAFVDEIRVGA